jgi:hypothetical protein
MDYGAVGSCATPATGEGAGVGGVSYLGVVQRFSYPAQTTLNLPVVPIPAAGPEGHRFRTGPIKNRFP